MIACVLSSIAAVRATAGIVLRGKRIMAKLRSVELRRAGPAAALGSRDRVREAAKTLFAKQGFEATSTAQIARLAATSQSQIIKHFINKQGLLEAIFQHAWEEILPALRLAVESIPSHVEKLKMVYEMVLNFFDRDPAIRTLFLIEGRRLRGDGHMVVLVPGFMRFIEMLDAIVKQVSEQGSLGHSAHPQAFRSALIGAVEGMLRDKMLSQSSSMPASFSTEDIRHITITLLNCFLK